MTWQEAKRTVNPAMRVCIGLSQEYNHIVLILGLYTRTSIAHSYSTSLLEFVHKLLVSQCYIRHDMRRSEN